GQAPFGQSTRRGSLRACHGGDEKLDLASPGRAGPNPETVMTKPPSISSAKFSEPKKSSVLILAAEGGGLSDHAKSLDPAGVLAKGFGIAEFPGKLASKLEILVPEGTGFDRFCALGAGVGDKRDEQAWLRL